MPVRFYDDLLRDRVAIVNFMYTDCGEGCPLVTANLAELHRRLGPRVGRDILMLSITLTPEMDTPEMLSAYAARFDATDPERAAAEIAAWIDQTLRQSSARPSRAWAPSS